MFSKEWHYVGSFTHNTRFSLFSLINTLTIDYSLSRMEIWILSEAARANNDCWFLAIDIRILKIILFFSINNNTIKPITCTCSHSQRPIVQYLKCLTSIRRESPDRRHELCMYSFPRQYAAITPHRYRPSSAAPAKVWDILYILVRAWLL